MRRRPPPILLLVEIQSTITFELREDFSLGNRRFPKFEPDSIVLRIERRARTDVDAAGIVHMREQPGTASSHNPVDLTQ